MKNILSEIQVLDCTLRDGSYPIDYQFTAEDTAVVSAGLEAAGFRLIEIGHGLGLGASREGHGQAAASDEEYLMAAGQTLTRSKFGMFCIPGIATLDDVRLAAKHKMDFIRIGTDVNAVHRGEDFVKEAKAHGMTVSYNLMKSYAVDHDGFARSVSKAAGFGSDIVCVVDSAGGMLPADVRAYVEIVKRETDCVAGFHGHDNLCMAAANSVEAVRAGAGIVDGSLQGMGRSAGNAQTAILVILLEKMGHDLGVDVYRTLDLGEKLIHSLVGGSRGVDSIGAILGAEQFHSSYLKIVQKHAQEFGVDARSLVREVSKINRVSVTDDIVRGAAEKLPPTEPESRKIRLSIDLDRIVQSHTGDKIEEVAKTVGDEMTSFSKKTGRRSVMTISPVPLRERQTNFRFIRHSDRFVLGNVEAQSVADVAAIVIALIGRLDYVLLDFGFYQEVMTTLPESKRTRILPYNDAAAQVHAVRKQIHQMPFFLPSRVGVKGQSPLAENLIRSLTEDGYCVYGNDTITDHLERIDLLCGMQPYSPVLTRKMLDGLKPRAVVLDAGPGCLDEDSVLFALEKGLQMIRMDQRAGLFGEVEAVISTFDLQHKIQGEKDVDGTRIIAGGVFGCKGDVVVDSIASPTRVVGIADGKGGLIGNGDMESYQKPVSKIRRFISESIFL